MDDNDVKRLICDLDDSKENKINDIFEKIYDIELNADQIKVFRLILGC
jgi:hypothetical protein